jgi:transglutaminase-like putative cysteine protease
MRVALTHTTRLEYSADVVEGVMDTRLGPLTDPDQRWERFELRVSPTASSRRYIDGFNNVAHLITVARAHGHLEVVTRSEVHTLLKDPFRAPETRPRPLGSSERFDYLAPSATIPRHPELAALAAPHRPTDPNGVFGAVQALMGIVYRGFTYQQHVTTVATTVPEVLAERIGVCQDFAHVLIGLCRAVDVPARYVSGYIVGVGQWQSQSQSAGGASGSQSQSQRQGMASGPHRGAAASHAWVEAYTPTHGWRGFDPTNNLVASEHHIKMAIGRDYNDVPPTRGTSRGAADEKLAVDVVTRLLD